MNVHEKIQNGIEEIQRGLEQVSAAQKELRSFVEAQKIFFAAEAIVSGAPTAEQPQPAKSAKPAKKRGRPRGNVNGASLRDSILSILTGQRMLAREITASLERKGLQLAGKTPLSSRVSQELLRLQKESIVTAEGTRRNMIYSLVCES